MKMHSQRFKDPLISKAQPFAILAPVIEESLRFAGVRPERELILERFMAGQPRVAVIHGSEDHPPSLGARELARKVIRQLWSESALPIGVSHAIPCEELSHDLPGAHYAFLGRNVCASNLAALMESHGYDAAFVLGACDKMFVGSLRALVEVDLARQRRKARPLYAAFIPVSVGPEVHLDESERLRFEHVREKISSEESDALFNLLKLPLSPAIYEKIKDCLDSAFQKRMILEAEKDELEGIVARLAASHGATPGSSEAAVVTRLIIAAFGLVPRKLELSLHPPEDTELAGAVRRLVQGIQKRERRISVAHLVKMNMQNAVSVWNATGGYTSWQLHLHYLAEAAGVRLAPAMLSRKMTKVPRLLSFNPEEGRSAPGLAAETDAGGNSGVDTLMRTLAEKRFIDDRAATLDGSWMHRITDARSANGKYFHSTMTPSSPNSGLVRLHGNIATSALARIGSIDRIKEFDQKIYLADFKLGREELAEAFTRAKGPLERLRKKVTHDDLYRICRINWPERARSNGGMDQLAEWDKKRLWKFLVDEKLLRVIIFVGGEGPRASGMPEVDALDSNSMLPEHCVIATDGRIAFAESNVSIAHIVPEVIDGGGLASVRTADWVYLNLKKGEMRIVTAARGPSGYKAVSERELSRRPESKKRIGELERRRASFLPSIRSVLDSVSTADNGVSPLAPVVRR
jgi:dihydroxyacid dehydratase/phosphogluconate dehydratase